MYFALFHLTLLYSFSSPMSLLLLGSSSILYYIQTKYIYIVLLNSKSNIVFIFNFAFKNYIVKLVFKYNYAL